MHRKGTEQKPKRENKNRNKKVLVSAKDNMQQAKASRADNQKSMKARLSLAPKGMRMEIVHRGRKIRTAKRSQAIKSDRDRSSTTLSKMIYL